MKETTATKKAARPEPANDDHVKGHLEYEARFNHLAAVSRRAYAAMRIYSDSSGAGIPSDCSEAFWTEAFEGICFALEEPLSITSGKGAPS